jgi:hypothetical protein
MIAYKTGFHQEGVRDNVVRDNAVSAVGTRAGTAVGTAKYNLLRPYAAFVLFIA